MIVDAHCHAWVRWPYEPAVPDSGRGSHDNLLWEMDRAGVDRAIVICAAIGGNEDNAGDVFRAAAATGGRLVPFADIDCRWHATHRTSGGAERLDALARRFPLRGVTHYLNENDSAGWLLSEEGLSFLGAIGGRNLILSLACGPGQVPVVTEVARRFPGLPILIHHLGRVRAGDEEALRLVVAAAGQANIHMKLSGFGYGVDDGWNFPLAPMRPIVEALVAAYGPERLVWGSDWPVSRRFMTYRQSLEMIRSHGPPMDEEARSLILGGTMLRLLGQTT